MVVTEGQCHEKNKIKMDHSHPTTWKYWLTLWRISTIRFRPSWGRRGLQGKMGWSFEVDGWGNATLNLLSVLAHLNRNTAIERDCFQLTIQLFTRNKIKKIRLKHHELFPRSYFNYSSNRPLGSIPHCRGENQLVLRSFIELHQLSVFRWLCRRMFFEVSIRVFPFYDSLLHSHGVLSCFQVFSEDSMMLCLQIKLLYFCQYFIDILGDSSSRSQHQMEKGFSEFPCQLSDFLSPVCSILCDVEDPQEWWLLQWLHSFPQNPNTQSVQHSEDFPDFSIEFVLQIVLGSLYFKCLPVVHRCWNLPPAKPMDFDQIY